MPTIDDVLEVLEDLAPARYAFGFDRIGLQVGSGSGSVRTAVVSLDSSPAAAARVVEEDGQLLLSHHPLIWEPLRTIDTSRHPGSTLARLIEAGAAFVAAHTNWDCAPGGINDVLAERLELNEVQAFGSSEPPSLFKLVVFVPEDARDALLDALSAEGAGRIGAYERCAFWSPGTGTFVGGDGTNPVVGQRGRIEEVPELRLEMLVPADRLGSVRDALLASHPYEEPAYDFLVLDGGLGQAAGRIGRLASSTDLASLATGIDQALQTRCWSWGDPSRPIECVAVVGGSADGEWRAAMAAGADVLVTGEVKQNVAVEADAAGFAIVAAGHYATEQPGMERLKELLITRLPEVRWVLFEPKGGRSGRPW